MTPPREKIHFRSGLIKATRRRRPRIFVSNFPWSRDQKPSGVWRVYCTIHHDHTKLVRRGRVYGQFIIILHSLDRGDIRGAARLVLRATAAAAAERDIKHDRRIRRAVPGREAQERENNKQRR